MNVILDTRARHVLNESDSSPENGRWRRAYRECRPPAALAGGVDCLWRREPWRPPISNLGVLPDGRMDLVWAANGEVVVIGPQTRPLGRPLPAEVVVVGVRFPPGVGPPLLGVPAHTLVDRHVSLDAIDARPAASLRRAFATIEHPAKAPAEIVRALSRSFDACRSDPVVRRAAALLEDPDIRVQRVADELALGVRPLERRFRETVGHGPKTLQRVLRFQRLLHALRLGHERAGGLAWIAAALGYSDQAHLTREARELSGLSPVQLKRVLGALEEEGASGIFKTGRVVS